MKRERQFDIEEFQEQWTCPITRMPMTNPVILQDGHSYEQNDIKQWLKKKKTSPKTNLPLKKTNLIPNIVLKSVIQKYHTQIKYEYQKLKQQKELLYQHIDEYQEKIDEYQEKIDEYQEKINQAAERQQELLKNQEDNNKRKSMISQGVCLEQKYENLKRMYNKLKIEHDFIRSQNQRKNKAIKNKRQQIAQKQQQQTVQNQPLQENSSSMNQQQQKEYHLSLQLIIIKANQTINSLQQDNKQLLQALDKKNQLYQQQIINKQKLKQQINQLQQKNNIFSKLLSQLSYQKLKLFKQNHQLVQKKKQQQKYYLYVNKQLDKLLTVNRQSQNRIKFITKQNSILLKQKSLLIKQNQNHIKQKQQLTKQNSTSLKQTTKLIKQKQTLTQQITILTQSNSLLTKQKQLLFKQKQQLFKIKQKQSLTQQISLKNSQLQNPQYIQSKPQQKNNQQQKPQLLSKKQQTTISLNQQLNLQKPLTKFDNILNKYTLENKISNSNFIKYLKKQQIPPMKRTSFSKHSNISKLFFTPSKNLKQSNYYSGNIFRSKYQKQQKKQYGLRSLLKNSKCNFNFNNKNNFNQNNDIKNLLKSSEQKNDDCNNIDEQKIQRNISKVSLLQRSGFLKLESMSAPVTTGFNSNDDNQQSQNQSNEQSEQQKEQKLSKSDRSNDNIQHYSQHSLLLGKQLKQNEKQKIVTQPERATNQQLQVIKAQLPLIIPQLTHQMAIENHNQKQKIQTIHLQYQAISMPPQRQQYTPLNQKSIQYQKIDRQPKQKVQQTIKQQNLLMTKQKYKSQHMNKLKQQKLNSILSNEYIPQSYMPMQFPVIILNLQDYLIDNPVLYDQITSTLDHSGLQVNMREFLKYNWTNIKTINFSNCQLGDRDFKRFVNQADKFPQLETLLLQNNLIVNLPQLCFQKFPKLKVLNLQAQNDLSQKSKKYLSQLKRINPYLLVTYKNN